MDRNYCDTQFPPHKEFKHWGDHFHTSGGNDSKITIKLDDKEVEFRLDEETDKTLDLGKTGDGKITIQQDGEDVGSFTVNQYDDTTINFAGHFGKQEWLPAVPTYNRLPKITDFSKSWLCRVFHDNSLPTDISRTSNNGVWQCVAGQPYWSYYSDNLDFVNNQDFYDMSDKVDIKVSGDYLSIEKFRYTDTSTGMTSGYHFVGSGYHLSGLYPQNGINGQVLTCEGPGNMPVWKDKIDSLSISGNKIANGTITLDKILSTSSSGYVITSTGPGLSPTWAPFGFSIELDSNINTETPEDNNPTISSSTSIASLRNRIDFISGDFSEDNSVQPEENNSIKAWIKKAFRRINYLINNGITGKIYGSQANEFKRPRVIKVCETEADALAESTAHPDWICFYEV